MRIVFSCCSDLFTDDLHFAVSTQFDDARGLVWLVLLTARPAHIVHLLNDTWVNVAIVLGSRLAADIGRGGDQRLLETVAELLGEGLIGDAQGNGAILGNEIGGQVHGTIEDDGGGLDARRR